MSEEERNRLIALGDKVFAQWEKLETSGQVSNKNYINVPRGVIDLAEVKPEQVDSTILDFIQRVFGSDKKSCIKKKNDD